MSTAASDAGHSHGVSPTADRRLLWLALLVIVGFMLRAAYGLLRDAGLAGGTGNGRPR